MTAPDRSSRWEEEAREIDAAADRLLAGTPVRSSGRLSVAALADEAGIKRSALYGRHRHLVEAFLDRVGAPRAHLQGSQTAELAAARTKIAELELLVAARDARIDSLTASLVEISLHRDSRDNLVPMRRPDRAAPT